MLVMVFFSRGWLLLLLAVVRLYVVDGDLDGVLGDKVDTVVDDASENH
jgi:hypothetical protein